MEKTTQTTITPEDAVKVFLKPCQFVNGVAREDQLPTNDVPEIAFIGRSNVGKSSLINAVVGQNNIARTSKTPGRTQQLNFFTLDESFYIVDFPGYGYAKASKQHINTWNKLMMQYLKGRIQLTKCFILIDSRHGVMKNDEEMMTLLDDVAVPYELVLTKTDKVKAAYLEKVKRETQDIISKHAACYPVLQATSAEKKTGIDEVRLRILKIAAILPEDHN